MNTIATPQPTIAQGSQGVPKVPQQPGVPGSNNAFGGMYNSLNSDLPSLINKILGNGVQNTVGNSTGNSSGVYAPQSQSQQNNNGNFIQGAEKFGTGLIPIGMGIGGSIGGGAAGALVPVADLTGVSEGAGAIGGYGAGYGLGRGIQSYIDQQVLHLTKPKSFGANLSQAVTQGAINAPFGILGAETGIAKDAVSTAGDVAAQTGVESTMQASRSAATKFIADTVQPIAKNMALGGAAGMTSGTLNALFNKTPPAQAIPAIISDGVYSALFMGGATILPKVFSWVLGGSEGVSVMNEVGQQTQAFTVNDLKANANKIVASFDSTANKTFDQALTRSASGEPNLNAYDLKSPEMKTLQRNDPQLYKDIADARTQGVYQMVGDKNAATFDKYNAISKKGPTLGSIGDRGGVGGGIEETISNTPQMGKNIYNNMLEPLKGVNVSKQSVGDVIDTVLQPYQKSVEKSAETSKIAKAVGKEATGNTVNPAVKTSINKIKSLVEVFKNQLPENLSSEDKIALQNMQDIQNIIDSYGSLSGKGTISGEDLLKLKSEVGKLAFYNNQFFGRSNPSTATGLTQKITESLYSKLQDLLKSSIKGSAVDEEAGNKLASDYVTASKEYKQFLDGKGMLSKANTVENIENNYSNEAVVENALKTAKKRLIQKQSMLFAQGVQKLSDQSPTEAKLFVLKTLGIPLGLISNIGSHLAAWAQLSSVEKVFGTSTASDDLEQAFQRDLNQPGGVSEASKAKAALTNSNPLLKIMRNPLAQKGAFVARNKILSNIVGGQ